MISPKTLRCFGATGGLWLACQLISCGGTIQRIFPQPHEDPLPEMVLEARHVYENRLILAERLRDTVTGWLTPDDCDGFLWTGLYASVRSVVGVNLYAAEYPTEPGRLSRRPGIPCWLDNGIENGSKSSFSRDMAMALLTYALAKSDPVLLQRHIAYGESHNWIMGSGSLAATYYNPLFVGVVRAVYAAIPRDQLTTSGPRWPSEYEYFSGLDDYEAHLQMLGINLRVDIEGTATPEMRARIDEQAAREPGNTFYQYLKARFSGDFTAALQDCIDGSKADYIRCGVGLNPELCQLSEDIFTCDILLKELNQ